MINPIYELTKLLNQQDVNLSNTKEEGKIIFINLDIKNKETSIIIEDYIDHKRNLYLYNVGETKGTTPAIFAQITEPQKTFSKIRSFFNKIYEFSQDMNEKILLNKIIYILEKNSDEIIEKISQEINEIKSNKLYKKNKVFLGVKIQEDSSPKYPGEIKIIRALEATVKEKKLTSNLEKTVCYFCQQEKDVSSEANTVYKFYTVDKPGFISSSQIIKFEKSKSWINYPVCIECYEILKKSKEILKNKLSFNMEGIKYFLIPVIAIDEPYAYQQIIEIIELIDKRQMLEETERITTDQQEIFSLLKDKNFIYFYLAFYEEINSAERILLVLEDIPPTNFHKIFQAKYKTKEIIQKYNTLKKYNPNYNISKLRRFFISKEKLLTIDSEKFFLEFIEKIFKIQPVNQSLLIKYTLITLKNIINNLYKFEGEIFNFETCVLDSLSNLLFFTNLGIVEICYFCGGGKMFENIYKDLNLDTYNKQGLFMLGCICRILLDKQRERLNNMPFLNKLKSLKMNKKDFQELLPFVINKFYEYDS
ncbi:MAG: TM1802 family CRISPR-associated protein, partial [Candidatus Calescibacterium sp.]|nr:TM1802 family CRISPR-associated protein [Candidatus Calescibacterium sp.]